MTYIQFFSIEKHNADQVIRITEGNSSKLTVCPPPCIFSARTVATSTTTWGLRPEYRHLMLKNFSMPMSAPKPASVTVTEK